MKVQILIKKEQEIMGGKAGKKQDHLDMYNQIKILDIKKERVIKTECHRCHKPQKGHNTERCNELDAGAGAHRQHITDKETKMKEQSAGLGKRRRPCYWMT